MNDINDILKDLKNLSNGVQLGETKEKIDTVIKDIQNIQNDIFEDLSSIDIYANPDDIGVIICDVMEKIDCDAYWTDYCNAIPVNDDDD